MLKKSEISCNTAILHHPKIFYENLPKTVKFDYKNSKNFVKKGFLK